MHLYVRALSAGSQASIILISLGKRGFFWLYGKSFKVLATFDKFMILFWNHMKEIRKIDSSLLSANMHFKRDLVKKNELEKLET